MFLSFSEEVRTKAETMSSNEYIEHFKDDGVKQQIECNEYFEEDSKKDIVLREEEVFEYEASRKSTLKKHIESVHEKVKYPCNLCEYKATTTGSLKSHIESVHEKVKYPCHLCEYKATKHSDVKKHIESVHEKVKHPCNKSYTKGKYSNSHSLHGYLMFLWTDLICFFRLPFFVALYLH